MGPGRKIIIKKKQRSKLNTLQRWCSKASDLFLTEELEFGLCYSPPPGSSVVRLFNLKQLDFEAKKKQTKNKYVFSAVGPCFISACPSCGIKFPERLSVRSDLSCLVPTVPGPCQVPHGAAAFRVRASAQPRDRTPDEPEHLQSISVCVQNILPLLLTVLTTGTVCSHTFKIVFYRLLHMWKIPCSYFTLLVLEVLFS